VIEPSRFVCDSDTICASFDWRGAGAAFAAFGDLGVGATVLFAACCIAALTLVKKPGGSATAAENTARQTDKIMIREALILLRSCRTDVSVEFALLLITYFSSIHSFRSGIKPVGAGGYLAFERGSK
jgi:hypothetical protein